MPEITGAFSSFAVPDLDEARRFYGETLGLQVGEDEMGFLRLVLPGGHEVVVYPKPDFEPASYTVLNLVVGDVEAAVDELGSRGVRFERSEGFRQDDEGIARGPQGPPIAWFEDPAGNVLSVLQTT